MSGSTPAQKRHKGLLATASIAALMGITACGGGGDEAAYCDTLQDHVDELAGIDTDNPETLFAEGMDGMVSMMEDSSSDVPEEIADEHASVQEIFQEINNIDLEAMMDMENLMDMDEDEIAEMEAEFEAIENRFEELEEDGERWGEWVEENCEIADPLD